MLPVVVDTREQLPFDFIGFPVLTKPASLQTGDYSIRGYEDVLCIERKSLGDLAGCMTAGRDRFEKELERMRKMECVAVVVEEPITHIRKGSYYSRIDPKSFEQSILSMMFRYRVPFLFGQSRRHAETIAFNCMRHFYNKTLPERLKIPYREYVYTSTPDVEHQA